MPLSFYENLIASVLSESPRDAGPDDKPPPSAPPKESLRLPARGPAPAALAALDAYVAEVATAHERASAAARAAYLELVRQLLPPRDGASPPADAHALAADASYPAPEPAALLARLEAAKKTPDDLKRDLKLLVILRAQADLVAAAPALEALRLERQQALEQLKTEHAAVARAQRAEEQLREQELEVLERERSRASEAHRELVRCQLTSDERDRLRHRGRALSFANAEEQARAKAEEAAADAAVRAHEERALRLELLERVVFPVPQPEPR